MLILTERFALPPTAKLIGAFETVIQALPELGVTEILLKVTLPVLFNTIFWATGLEPP